MANQKARSRWIPNLVTGLLVAGMLMGSVAHTLQYFPGLRTWHGEVEQSVLYLKENLQPEEVVVVTSDEDAPVWYYTIKYGFAPETLSRNVPFRSAYVLVNPSREQTYRSVIAERGPDSVFFDWSSARLSAKFGTLELYTVQADWEAVQRAYGLVEP
jgi:hypothetical protein